jgi:hypothetical protein
MEHITTNLDGRKYLMVEEDGFDYIDYDGTHETAVCYTIWLIDAEHGT